MTGLLPEGSEGKTTNIVYSEVLEWVSTAVPTAVPVGVPVAVEEEQIGNHVVFPGMVDEEFGSDVEFL